MKTRRHLLRALLHAKIESRLIALTCALLISSLFLASDASAQISISTTQADPASVPTTTRSKSTVRGRVIYDDTGRPLRVTDVSVFKMTRPIQDYSTTTNERGEFSVENLPAGKYAVIARGPEITVCLTAHTF